MSVGATTLESVTAKQVAVGVRAFFRLADLWGLTRDEQEVLLGRSVKRTRLYEWQLHPPTSLSDDQLARISYLLGLYEGLQRIWRRTPLEADRWVRRELLDEPFSGRTPLATMLVGGLPAMARVRAYVDTAAGGPPSRDQSLRLLPEGPPLEPTGSP